jgi:hypothetical protein
MEVIHGLSKEYKSVLFHDLLLGEMMGCRLLPNGQKPPPVVF